LDGVCYSGLLVVYFFGEVIYCKGSWLVDFGFDGVCGVEVVEVLVFCILLVLCVDLVDLLVDFWYVPVESAWCYVMLIDVVWFWVVME